MDNHLENEMDIWVVVKIMVSFWIPTIIRHLIFRVPKKGTIILTTTHILQSHKKTGFRVFPT